MSILHTVNKSPFEKNSLQSCIKHAKSGSAVLLIEDGVYGALNGTAVADAVSSAMNNIDVYVLQPDVETRGIRIEQIISGVKLVDYAGFVDLTTKHDKVQSWL